MAEKHPYMSGSAGLVQAVAQLRKSFPTPLANASEIDEQKGYRFLFSGAVMAIRNPRGHEVNLNDDVDTCLDHLAFASLLLRRLEQARYA